MRKRFFSSQLSSFLIIPFVLLLIFTFLLYQATFLLNYQFFNKDNLVFIADALLLRDVTELSSLRLFTVFPQLPIYMISFLSYIPSLPVLMIPHIISSFIMALILGNFLNAIKQTKASSHLIILVALAITIHPLIILSASNSGHFIWSAISSVIAARALFSLSFFHTLPLVYVGWGIALTFLMDVQFFAVIASLILLVIICLNHQHYFYDYLAAWLALLFPLILMLILIYLASYFQANRVPGFTHGLPNIDFSFNLIVDDLLKRTWQAGKILVQQIIFFPIVIVNLFLLVKHKRLLPIAFGSFLFPGLVSFFAVEQVRGDFSFVIYAIGPMLASSFHVYHLLKRQYYLFCFMISLLLGSSVLLLIPHFESHTHSLLNVYLGKTAINPDIHEDFALGTFLKQQESVMLDYRSTPAIIAHMERANHLIVPHTELFKIAEELKKFHAAFILIPQHDTPYYQRDRVAKIYINIYQKNNFDYAPIYNSKRWLLLKRNDK